VPAAIYKDVHDYLHNIHRAFFVVRFTISRSNVAPSVFAFLLQRKRSTPFHLYPPPNLTMGSSEALLATEANTMAVTSLCEQDPRRKGSTFSLKSFSLAVEKVKSIFRRDSQQDDDLQAPKSRDSIDIPTPPPDAHRETPARAAEPAKYGEQRFPNSNEFFRTTTEDGPSNYYTRPEFTKLQDGPGGSSDARESANPRTLTRETNMDADLTSNEERFTNLKRHNNRRSDPGERDGQNPRLTVSHKPTWRVRLSLRFSQGPSKKSRGKQRDMSVEARAGTPPPPLPLSQPRRIGPAPAQPLRINSRSRRATVRYVDASPLDQALLSNNHRSHESFFAGDDKVRPPSSLKPCTSFPLTKDTRATDQTTLLKNRSEAQVGNSRGVPEPHLLSTPQSAARQANCSPSPFQHSNGATRETSHTPTTAPKMIRISKPDDESTGATNQTPPSKHRSETWVNNPRDVEPEAHLCTPQSTARQARCSLSPFQHRDGVVQEAPYTPLTAPKSTRASNLNVEDPRSSSSPFQPRCSKSSNGPPLTPTRAPRRTISRQDDVDPRSPALDFSPLSSSPVERGRRSGRVEHGLASEEQQAIVESLEYVDCRRRRRRRGLADGMDGIVVDGPSSPFDGWNTPSPRHVPLPHSPWGVDSSAFHDMPSPGERRVRDSPAARDSPTSRGVPSEDRPVQHSPAPGSYPAIRGMSSPGDRPIRPSASSRDKPLWWEDADNERRTENCSRGSR
jgi:hypothetical protein